MATVEERVAAGVAWLDENHSGWEARIKLEKLDMADCFECVLGQLFGNFYNRNGHELNDQQAVEMGLYSASNNYRSLNQEWRRVITARLEQSHAT